jgi:hypothetical protein
MVNYANGKIYKIESTLGDKIYVGSTTKEQLSQRMSTHRSNYKSWKVGKGSRVTSFQLFDEYGLENCKIVLLEDCQCETKDQLTAREAHYIRTLVCVNKYVPLRTEKERYEENKEAILAKHKKYCEENKEAISAKKKEYYGENKEAVSAKQKEWREQNKEAISAKQKEWREQNKEAVSAKKKDYYVVNKERLLAKQKEYYAKNKSPS